MKYSINEEIVNNIFNKLSIKLTYNWDLLLAKWLFRAQLISWACNGETCKYSDWEVYREKYLLYNM